MEELRNILRLYSNNEYLIDSTIKKIKTCMETKDAETPIYFDKVFKKIGAGAYKFAFEPIPGVIIKFCNEFNDTEEEIELYKKAHNYGVGFTFVPTSFYELPTPVYCSLFVNDKDFHNPEYNYIEIQPKVNILETAEGIEPEELEDYLIEIGVSFDKETNVFHVGSWDWIIGFFDCYGPVKMQTFVDFCNIFYVSDLHKRNIGFWNNYPVIVDWLSDTYGAPTEYKEEI